MQDDEKEALLNLLVVLLWRLIWPFSIVFPSRAIIILLLFLLLGAGCDENEGEALGQLENATADVQLRPTSSLPIANPNRTTTPSPTSPSQLIATPSRTAVLSTQPPPATMTLTPVPTLTASEKSTLLTDLMMPKDNCLLPCWWEIVPGDTKLSEVQERFASVDLERWQNDFDNTYTEVTLGDRDEYDFVHPEQMKLRLYYEDDLVTALRVSSWKYAFPDQSEFDAYWDYYNVANVLNRYGNPSQVHFLLSPNPTQVLYELILTFEEVGFQINYMAPHQEFESGNSGACFNIEDVSAVQAAIFPAGSPPEEHLLTKRGEFVVPTWQEATGIELEAFYEMTGADPGLCVTR